MENLAVLKELTVRTPQHSKRLLTLNSLEKLEISKCENITRLAVGVHVQQLEQGQEEDGLLLIPAHLCDSLQELVICKCPNLVLVDPLTFLPAEGGGFQAVRSLERLKISECSNLLSPGSFSRCLFPSSLQKLFLQGVEGMGTLEPLSNLTSLMRLELWSCGENLRCTGLGPLLTTTGQLRKLRVHGSPRFFAGWDPRPAQIPRDVSSSSLSKLQKLLTDEAADLLVEPICTFLSSSLIELRFYQNQNIEGFTTQQEDALSLLNGLRELGFEILNNLQQLPRGLYRLTNLKRLVVYACPTVQSLPIDGLPESLEELYVPGCGSDELEQQCEGLVGTIPRIILSP